MASCRLDQLCAGIDARDDRAFLGELPRQIAFAAPGIEHR